MFQTTNQIYIYILTFSQRLVASTKLTQPPITSWFVGLQC